MKKLLVLFLLVLSTLAVFAEEIDWLIEDVEGGQRGNILYLSSTNGPKTLNNYWAQETSSSDIIGYFQDALLKTTNKGFWNQAGMAKEFWKEETPEGGVAYYFTLRKGLKWSDGMPLTIDDFVFTWEKIVAVDGMTANGNDGYRDADGNLPVLEVVNGDTLKFTYPTKYRMGYEYIGGTLNPFPKHLFEDRVSDPDTFAQTWTTEQLDQVVSSGPFIIKEYKPGVRVVLERNPYYYVKSKDGVQLPYLDQVIYLIVPNTETEKLKFEAGEIDLYGPTAQQFPGLKAEAAEKGWNTIVGSPVNSSQFIAFNFNADSEAKRMWFRDPNFRKAVAFAFDKQSVIDNLYNGLGVPLYGPKTPTSAWYDSSVEDLGFKYSVSQAKRLLKNAGFKWVNGKLFDKNDVPVAFNLSTNVGNNVREEIGNILVDSLQKLGMEVVYRPINFNTLVQQLLGGDFDSIIIGLTGGDDPGFSTNVWKLTGGLHFWNYSPESLETVDPEIYEVSDAEKRIDEIMTIQASTIDEQELRNLFNEFQMLVAENQVLIYTVSQNYLAFYNAKVHLRNPEPNPLAGTLWRPYGIWKE